MSEKIGQIKGESSVFFLCDVQEKFQPVIIHFDNIVQTCCKLLSAGKILEVPLLVTEQYPKGLGKTVPALDVAHARVVAEKTRFSMLVPEVDAVLEKLAPKVVVIMGVEAHVCVEQTATELVQRGYTVHIVADGVSSRSQEDRLLALQRLRQIGCFISTSESIIFKLLGDKNHPKFAEVRGLVKQTSPDTGLAKI
ncbi:Isochorismatase domain-containing protein 1 [Amphibalanus amphitrite]|uniref:Isochorismatase domain-containing protein 1 n=1 Tax=Amphibalanus amphitrite TaxID=1232801 RepID=A0A6A4X564_AMPAM|nr:Isochorismatase domain-containing protein 1 [Amphibalanus amphitrite]